MIQLILSWGPATAWAGLLFYLSSRSWDLEGLSFQLNDKVLHLVFYLVLGSTLAWAGRRSRRGWAPFALILVGMVFAGSDEWHQSFVPLRDSSVGDFLADTVGILIGFSLARWLLGRLRKRNPLLPWVDA
ncbi:MAG: VanZ family protein [Longimicrobiales bacterium]|nr:VanZ family protein [Longimicrobiales bacterium]